MLKAHEIRLNCGLYVKSSYITCKKSIHKWGGYVIQALQKIGYKVCTCISRLGLGHFCEHGILISLSFCRFLLK